MTESEVVKNMVKALEINIDYLKNDPGFRTGLSSGEFINFDGQSYLYRFRIASFIPLNKNLRLRVVQDAFNQSQARFAGLKNKTVSLKLKTKLSDSVEKAQLLIEDYEILNRLKERLKDRKTPDGLSKYLFNLKAAGEDTDLRLIRDSGFNKLNRYQAEALESTLRNKITYIWGPPGSGKTETIAQITKAFSHNNLSTLLLSHTNIATDQSVLKTYQAITSKNDGDIIRVGKISHPDLKKYEEKLGLSSILNRRCQKSLAKLDQLRNRIDRNKKVIQLLNKRINKIRNISELVNKARKLELTLAEQTKSRLGSKIRNILAGKQPAQSKQDTERLKDYRLKIERIKANYDLASIHHDLKASETKLAAIHKQTDYLLAELRRTSRLTAKQTQRLINQAQIIATTLTSAYSNKLLSQRQYDCLIVDEASTALLPSLWFAGNLVSKRVVVVGDFFQLPPVVNYKSVSHSKKSMADKETVDLWLKRNIFELLNIESSIRNNLTPPVSNLYQLKEQYRMVKPIAELLNKLVYSKYSNGRYSLITKTKKLNKFINQPRLSLYNTHNLRPETKTDSGQSKYCLQHIKVSLVISQRAVEDGYDDIGIITAYKSQASKIRKAIKQNKLTRYVTADTIHRFQGEEKQLIIFDITTPVRPSMYANDDGVEKLLAVAISRAKYRFVVLADVQAIIRNHPRQSLIVKLLYNLREQVISA